MESILALVLALGVPSLAALAGFKMWLDRLHPVRKPDPTGAELLEALEAHYKEVTKTIDTLAGKVALRDNQPRRLRE